jgi:expansin (peptidoglycan-binding protein)
LNGPQFDPFTPADGNPNKNTICNKRIIVTGPKGTVEVSIVDKCPECKKGDVDLSPTAFDMIADRVDGRVAITWKWA